MNIFGLIVDLSAILILIGFIVVVLVVLWSRKRISRVTGVIGQRVDDLIKAVDPPEKMIDRAYERRKDAVRKLNSGIVQITVTKAKLQKMNENYEEKITELGEKIDATVKKKDKVKAEHYLKVRKMYQVTKEKTEKNIEDMKKRQKSAIDIRDNAKLDLEMFETQRDILKSRLAVGESIRDIQADVFDLGEKENSRDLVNEVEEKIRNMEAETTAIDELSSTGVLDGDKMDIDVSDELRELFPEEK